jgi:hypothetical protein
MYSRRQFQNLEAMCRQRAAVARKGGRRMDKGVRRGCIEIRAAEPGTDKIDTSS